MLRTWPHGRESNSLSYREEKVHREGKTDASRAEPGMQEQALWCGWNGRMGWRVDPDLPLHKGDRRERLGFRATRCVWLMSLRSGVENVN